MAENGSEEGRMISLLRKQEEEGLVLLQKRYANRIRYIAAGILSDRQDVEECVSDVCMRIWKHIETFEEGKGKFSTWLTAVARNTALSFRKKGADSRREWEKEWEDGTAPTESPEEILLERERAKELKSAVAGLSSGERSLFYRKYYYLQSTRQMAAELGLTERSVEGKLYRIRKKLMKRLGGGRHE